MWARIAVILGVPTTLWAVVAMLNAPPGHGGANMLPGVLMFGTVAALGIRAIVRRRYW